jgi:hypothetical protein
VVIAAAFIGGAVAVTVAEGAAGKPLPAVVQGKPGHGTTFGGGPAGTAAPASPSPIPSASTTGAAATAPATNATSSAASSSPAASTAPAATTRRHQSGQQRAGLCNPVRHRSRHRAWLADGAEPHGNEKAGRLTSGSRPRARHLEIPPAPAAGRAPGGEAAREVQPSHRNEPATCPASRRIGRSSGTIYFRTDRASRSSAGLSSRAWSACGRVELRLGGLLRLGG